MWGQGENIHIQISHSWHSEHTHCEEHWEPVTCSWSMDLTAKQLYMEEACSNRFWDKNQLLYFRHIRKQHHMNPCNELTSCLVCIPPHAHCSWDRLQVHHYVSDRTFGCSCLGVLDMIPAMFLPCWDTKLNLISYQNTLFQLEFKSMLRLCYLVLSVHLHSN